MSISYVYDTQLKKITHFFTFSDETWISDLRRHPSFSECFQILVDPTIAHTQLAGLQENAEHGPHKEDSLVPGYIEGVCDYIFLVASGTASKC